MQNDTDIYTNFRISPLLTIVVVIIVVIAIIIRLVGARILKRISLRKQSKEIAISKKDVNLKIDEAIAKIRQIQEQLATNNISGKDAAFQASQITRETYDLAMNHTTRYQAKYETRLRSLQHISDLLDRAYAPEFNPKNHNLQTDDELFNQAIGALESCR